MLATLSDQPRGEALARRRNGLAAEGDIIMVVHPSECVECARTGSTEAAIAIGGKSGVSVGDEVLVLAMLLFAVISLFIFSSGET